MRLDFSGEKLRLIYPCQWGYKVIGSGQDKLRRAIAEVLREQIYTVSLSNRSKTGKYCCLNLETEVHSEENRTQIYSELQNHPAIRIVL